MSLREESALSRRLSATVIDMEEAARVEAARQVQAHVRGQKGRRRSEVVRRWMKGEGSEEEMEASIRLQRIVRGRNARKLLSMFRENISAQVGELMSTVSEASSRRRFSMSSKKNSRSSQPEPA